MNIQYFLTYVDLGSFYVFNTIKRNHNNLRNDRVQHSENHLVCFEVETHHKQNYSVRILCTYQQSSSNAEQYNYCD